MLKIEVEPLATVRPDVQALLEQHYQELTLNKEYVKLNVAWGRYEILDNLKALVILTVRDAGVLVGYSAFFLQRHLHYQDLLVAINDVLFLTKDYRKKFATGWRLIKKSEQHLQSIGVEKIVWHVKAANDFSPALRSMGYSQEEVVMGKLLIEEYK